MITFIYIIPFMVQNNLNYELNWEREGEPW